MQPRSSMLTQHKAAAQFQYQTEQMVQRQTSTTVNVCVCVVLVYKPKTSNLLHKYFTTELSSQPIMCVYFCLFGFLCSPGHHWTPRSGLQSTGTEASTSKALLFIFPKNRVSPCNPVSGLVIFLSSCPCLPSTQDYGPMLPCFLLFV